MERGFFNLTRRARFSEARVGTGEDAHVTIEIFVLREKEPSVRSRWAFGEFFNFFCLALVISSHPLLWDPSDLHRLGRWRS